MKKGYKKLLIIQSIILLILLINSFFLNILDNYIKIIFLLLVIVIFKKNIGIERDNHRYTKDIIFEILIFLLIFFIIYYLLGIIIGFAKTENYYTINGIIKFIIPIILIVILKEYLRYSMIMKAEGSLLLVITTIILFILFDSSNAIFYNSLKTKYDLFSLFSLTLLPAISTHIICSYLVYKVGYKPSIVYLLIIELYQYLIPIVPNPNEYLSSVIKFLLPIYLLHILNKFYKHNHEEELNRDYKKKNILSILMPTFLISILVYFSSGYFKYYSIAIASGSMEKVLSKGDVVIVEKIKDDYKSLKEGNIIAYKYEGIIVVHRIEKIIKNKNKLKIYTKGDANKNIDNYVVEEEYVIGKVKFKVPLIGLPTVWLNEL